jgi:hypothetical protein
MQGMNTGLRSFGQFLDMPESYQAAMESGLSYFELRFQGEKRFSQNIFGFFDVRVERSNENIRRRTVYETRWRTGRDAKITYNCFNQKTGLSVALAVDDPFWHNRIVMAFNPVYLVFQLHTPDGMVPGSIIMAELECLREICQDRMKQYCAINQFGKTVFAAYKEAEVDEFIARKRGQPGNIAPLRKAARTAWITKKFVEEIIARNDRTQYGWTNSDDFRRYIREPTMELITRRGISRTIDTSPAISQQRIEQVVANTLKNMSIDQLKELLKSKETGREDVPEIEYPKKDQEGIRVTSFDSDVQKPEFKTKTFFLRMRMEDAIQMAKERGIAGYEGMTRPDLCSVLYESEMKRKDAWEAQQKSTLIPVGAGEAPEEEMVAQ